MRSMRELGSTVAVPVSPGAGPVEARQADAGTGRSVATSLLLLAAVLGLCVLLVPATAQAVAAEPNGPAPGPAAPAQASPSGAAAVRRFPTTTETSVFGATGQGSLFVYVFDRSDSMNDYRGGPLAASRSELIRSLQSLQPTHQFQILFYNSRITAFNPSRARSAQLMFATEQNKELAARFVEQVPASNGTQHMDSLRLALRLAPDVIFLLTDAGEPQLTASELERLRQLNTGTVINAIEFGVGPDPGGDNFLKQLARQSGGQHVYVDVTSLPDR